MKQTTRFTLSELPGLARRSLSRLAGASTLALALAVAGVTSLVLPQGVLAQELAQAGQVATVNINTADAETLAGALQGVGLSRAQEIIRYRESYGPFKTVDELADVKGIGPSTLDKNRERITLE